MMNISTKPLIATIVFNANKITNECFLESLYKRVDESKFDLLIVTTSDIEFVLDKKHTSHININHLNFKKLYGISTHGAAIQKILNLFTSKYDDIIICENDVVVKQNLLNIIDREVQFAGRDSKSINHHLWWTRLYSKMHFGCQRYLPVLMYFNVKSFNDRKIVYEKYDCNLKIDIDTLNIHLNLKNTWLCDPGWYFMVWCEANKIKCKDIDIDQYISHFWYGSENRNSNSEKTYQERLNDFKQQNIKYL